MEEPEPRFLAYMYSVSYYDRKHCKSLNCLAIASQEQSSVSHDYFFIYVEYNSMYIFPL